MSCDRGYGIIGYPDCSGNGDCINGQCVCIQGWSSVSDFELVPGYDCDINIDALRYISFVNIILSCIAIAVISACIYHEVRYILSNNKSLRDFDGKLSCMVFFTLSSLTILILSVLKYLNPIQSSIGSSRYEPGTIISGLTIGFLMYSISSFYLVIINFLKGYVRFIRPEVRNSLERVMSVTSRIAFIFPTIGLICLEVILALARTLRPSQSDNVAIGYVLSISLLYMYYAFVGVYIFFSLLTELRKFIWDAETRDLYDNHLTRKTLESAKNLYRKFNILNYICAPVIICGAPLNIIWASWSFLRRKLVYLLLLECTLIVIFGPLLAWSIRSNGKQIMVPLKSESESKYVSMRQNFSVSMKATISKVSVITNTPIVIRSYKLLRVFPTQPTNNEFSTSSGLFTPVPNSSKKTVNYV